MKVLYVTTTSRIGGAENFLLRLVNGIRKYLNDFTANCVITHEFGGLHNDYYKTFDALEDLRRVPQYDSMISIIERDKYDLIHNSVGGYEFMADIAAIFYERIPVIQCILQDVSIPIFDESQDWKRVMRKGAKGWTKVVIEMKKNYDALSDYFDCRDKLEIIQGGIDTDFWTPSGKKAKKVCWVGRVTTEKGVHILMELVKRMPDVKFSVVANEANDSRGFFHKDVLALSRKSKNLEYRWSLTPEQLREIYRESMIFLHTSLFESQPRTPMEAMACGCIPICGDIGGLSDIVNRNDGGYLVDMDESTDRISAFKEAIEHCMSRRSSSFLNRSRDRIIDLFSLDSVVKRYIEMYEETIKK